MADRPPDSSPGRSADVGVALFLRFVRTSPDAIAVTRRSDGRILLANAAFLRLIGFKRDEVMGRTTLDLGIWVDEAERERLLEAVRQGPTGGVEFRLRRKSGEIRLVESSVQPIDLRGEECILAIDRDVTHRKLFEAERRRAHELLRATVESTTDGILVVDNTGRVTFANERFGQMWRIPPEVLETGSDRNLLEFVLDQLRAPEAFLSKVRQLYGSDSESFDTLLFRDGRIFERYSRPLIHGRGREGRVWSFRDVTNQRRAEEATRDAELKYRSLVEKIPAITYIDAARRSGRTLYISPQTKDILGFTQQEWLDDPALLATHVHPDDRFAWGEMNRRCDQTGDPFRQEYRIVRKDGRVVWVRDEASLVRDEQGRPQFWQGVMFDITERKRTEEQLEQAWQKEIEAGRQLRALDDMKNTFLQAVSHELRTPLTAVLGSALTLEREDVELAPEDQRSLLKGIANNARKLNQLLTDLLDMDRLARGIIEPKRVRTDVGELVKLAVEASGLLVNHPVDMQIEPVILAVDPPKIERIVENLLANTARHTPPGTPVWVKVQASSEGALISVEDGGPGVPPALRESIFQPFQQGRSRNPHSPGVGIGLTLVARFAELHGGRAWVEGRIGGGSAFRVFLPRAPMASEALAGEPEKPLFRGV